MPLSDLKGKRPRRHHIDVATVDIDEEELHTPGKRCRGDNGDGMRNVYLKLNEIMEDVDLIKENLEDMMHLNEKSLVPLGLKRLLRDSFQCKICMTVPIKPPVIMSKCCKAVIGCEACVNHLYTRLILDSC